VRKPMSLGRLQLHLPGRYSGEVERVCPSIHSCRTRCNVTNAKTILHTAPPQHLVHYTTQWDFEIVIKRAQRMASLGHSRRSLLCHTLPHGGTFHIPEISDYNLHHFMVSTSLFEFLIEIPDINRIIRCPTLPFYPSSWYELCDNAASRRGRPLSPNHTKQPSHSILNTPLVNEGVCGRGGVLKAHDDFAFLARAIA